MKILLDTHCWLWWISSPEKLSPDACRQIADKDHVIYLSVASAWEIAIKYSLGKLPLPEVPWEFVHKRLARDAITPLAIEARHALGVADLPRHHRDPFDRLILSQSILEDIPIMTVDRQFAAYEAEIIWAV
jgi:PIN domain nuclease of toxin-antitoxin system